MRHRVYGKHLGRNKNQRTALFKGLVRSLILEEAIITSEAKAKAVRGLFDRLVVRSKEGSTAGRNVLLASLPQKDVLKKLTEEIAPRYKNRTSGFTNLVRMGTRPGDGTMMVKLSLVEEETPVKAEKPEDKKAKTEKTADKKEGRKPGRSAAKNK